MATAQARLTPTADTTPAVVSIPAREPSGAAWVARFPGSRSVDDCVAPFKDDLAAFIAALREAGANVRVSATFRPPERAYMMHWAWMIWKGTADPQKIPARDGVLIKWDHVGDDGSYSKEKSVAGAKAMAMGFDIDDLGVAPALESEHTKRLAVDMTISWTGDLTINDVKGKETTIKTSPKTGMNKDLHAVGATYSVIKYSARGTDKPHWSSTGK